jgi:hypothetical protein
VVLTVRSARQLSSARKLWQEAESKVWRYQSADWLLRETIRAKSAVRGPAMEENLALIQTMKQTHRDRAGYDHNVNPNEKVLMLQERY